MSDQVYTLPSDTPGVGVDVAVQLSFFEEKKWRLVVERQNVGGFVVQRDITHGLTIVEAAQHRNDLATVYASDGWEPKQTGVQFEHPTNGDIVFVYVDADQH